MINRHKEFYQIHSLKQLTTCPTRVTCNISNLFDHILTNSTETIFWPGIIDSGISDHQLIFCTRNLKRVKFHKHSNVLLRSFKPHTVNLLFEGLRKENLLNFFTNHRKKNKRVVIFSCRPFPQHSKIQGPLMETYWKQDS